MWKNSSWVRSLPAMNWMSSISSTSIARYFERNAGRRSKRIALIISLMKRSVEMYERFSFFSRARM